MFQIRIAIFCSVSTNCSLSYTTSAGACSWCIPIYSASFLSNLNSLRELFSGELYKIGGLDSSNATSSKVMTLFDWSMRNRQEFFLPQPSRPSSCARCQVIHLDTCLVCVHKLCTRIFPDETGRAFFDLAIRMMLNL